MPKSMLADVTLEEFIAGGSLSWNGFRFGSDSIIMLSLSMNKKLSSTC